MKKIVFAVCGSFCNHARALAVLEEFVGAGYSVTAVLSENAAGIDTRFGKASAFAEKIRMMTGCDILTGIAQVESGITGKGFDGAVVCPCTGNTLAKLRYGVSDTSVTMAVKCLLRNDKPILIALATNDALGASFENLAALRNRRNFSFVPLARDDPFGKPNSMICDFTKVRGCADAIFGAD